MRYLSVCSGIEAASVAWHHLGWTPVAFSEIEPFPAAVLKHRFPNVPNYGDMTKHQEWPLEPGSIDLLVGGTPCQSFSVAGLRKGLNDPRGGLMLTYLEIAQRLRPRWIVWENVPGVLSSGDGRDLGAFLGALGELGYGWAYRVLDAQWVRTQRHPRAVPQRRRRIFVVGCLGDYKRSAAVLFERESVQRDSAPRRAQGQGSAADAEGCAATVSSKWAKGTGGPAGDECYNLTTQPIAGTIGNRGLRSHTELGGHGAYIPVAFSQNQREEVRVLDVPGALQSEPATHQQTYIAQPVPFTKAKRAQSTTDDETWVDGQVNPTLSLFDQGDTRATTAVVAVDLYNQSIDGDCAATLTEACGGTNTSGPKVMAFPIDTQNMTEGHASGGLGFGQHGDPSFTVTKGHSHAVAFSSNMGVPDCQTDGSTPTVKVGSNGSSGHPPAVAFTRCDNGQDASVEVTPTMRCGSNYSAHPAVAHTLRGEGFNASEDGTGRGTPLVPHAMTVRRLTPRECERLQGFPDDWTLIPWRGKPAKQCPDGPRYKALGNSMACNCMAWIGERIAAVERTT